MDLLGYQNPVFYNLNVRAFLDSSGVGHVCQREVITKLEFFHTTDPRTWFQAAHADRNSLLLADFRLQVT
jgi:hypothetical protein